jgi:uncharacterized membrane protein YraQ (UPF0718 family)
MSDCCSQKPKPVTPSCCASEQGASNPVAKTRPDYLLWGSGFIVLVSYISYFLIDGHPALPEWVAVMTAGVYELVNRMWWGLVAAVVFVGLLNHVPRDLVMAILGPGGTFKGIFRATMAGVLLDLCSHGILMVGVKLYERGASLGQLMAFLIASPWNSLSLTIILIALIGFWWTLIFVLLSMVVGIITGMLFDRLVKNNTLPANPNYSQEAGMDKPGKAFMDLLKSIRPTPSNVGSVVADGLKSSRMVFRWLLFGIVLATLIRAFVPMDTYQTYFGPTMVGLILTTIFATIIEVCSEGSTPIAADLVTRAAAPGNGFTFLMAGVATDYTEVMVIKDTTKSWKIALYLPLLTLPQVLLIGYILNQFSV